MIIQGLEHEGAGISVFLAALWGLQTKAEAGLPQAGRERDGVQKGKGTVLASGVLLGRFGDHNKDGRGAEKLWAHEKGCHAISHSS